jgi:hypothetical protein
MIEGIICLALSPSANKKIVEATNASLGFAEARRVWLFESDLL